MALSDIVAVMPPATWYELPGTKLSGAYAITDTGDPRYGVKGPQSVPEDWCGGAFDTDNHIFLQFGGGHRSYGGNEVYEFPLDTLVWSHNTPSTYVADVASSGGDNWKTTDGAPTSVHSYDGLQYIPGTNKMFKFGGARWESGDPGDSYAYLYDTITHTWERKAAAPVDVLEPATAYDASRNCVWVWGRKEILRYNITQDTWDTVQSGIDTQTGRVAAYDPINDRLVGISARMTPNVCYYDCANGGGLQTVTVTGASPSLYEIGFAYDTSRQIFVLWPGYGDVYSLDPSTWVATQIDAGTGAAPSPPSTDYHGVYSKWQYLPTYDAFIAYNGANQNAWIYKAGVAGSGPAPGWGDPQRVVALTVGDEKASGSHTGFRIVLTRANLPDEICDPSSGNAAQVNGGDIRVTADAAGTIRLPLHILKFALDSSTGAKDAGVEMWTLLPSLSSGTAAYIWYHSATTQAQPAVDEAFGRNAVYAGLIVGWHADSNTTLADVTGGGWDMTITSGGGVVGGPYADPGVNIKYNSSTSMSAVALGQDYTVTLLMARPGTMGVNKGIAWINGDDGAGGYTTAAQIYSSSGSAMKFSIKDDSGTETVIATGVSFPTTWETYSLVSPVGLGDQSLYAGGSLVATQSATRRAGAGPISLAGAAASVYYAKIFVAKGLQSADWITTQNNNLSDPGSFFVAGMPQTPASYGLIAGAAQAAATWAAQAMAIADWAEAAQASAALSSVAQVAAGITESVIASDSDGEAATVLAAIAAQASGNDMLDALAQAAAAISAGAAAGESWTNHVQALAELVERASASDVITASATSAHIAAITEQTQASAAFVAAVTALAQITGNASATDGFGATSADAPVGEMAGRAAAADTIIATVTALAAIGEGAIAGDSWTGTLAQLLGAIREGVAGDALITARATVMATLAASAHAGAIFTAKLPGQGYLIAGAITLTAALSGTVNLKPH